MRILPCVVVLCGFAGVARADYSKAWNAAKANLPATTRAIAMIDLNAFDKSPHFEKLLRDGLAAERELAEFDAEIKQLCKLDLVKTVEGLVVSGDPDKQQVVFYLQLASDRIKTSACFEALMSKKTGEKVVLKQEGIYTVLTSKTGNRSLHVAWPAPNVVAFTFDPANKADIARWVGRGGLASAPVTPLVAKIDPKAIAAFAFVFDKPIDRKIPLASGYGHLLKAGNALTLLMTGRALDATSANSLKAELDKELQRERARASVPVAIKNMLAKIAFTIQGAEITLRGSGTEKDLVEAIAAEVLKPKKPPVYTTPP
jgi:hypothetical protein